MASRRQQEIAAAKVKLNQVLADLNIDRRIFDKYPPTTRSKSGKESLCRAASKKRLAVWLELRKPRWRTNGIIDPPLSYPLIAAACNCSHSTVIAAVWKFTVRQREEHRTAQSPTGTPETTSLPPVSPAG